MAIRPILRYPDQRLHQIAKPITVFDTALKELVSDMAETLYAAPGIGLAASQIDQHVQLIIIDISKAQNELLVFVNPEIVWTSEEKTTCDEGCLSVPGVYDGVTRPSRVKVRAHDVEGKLFDLEAQGLLAVCIQHELDHLKGIVFVEYLSQLKRNRIKTRLLKEEREQQKHEKKLVAQAMKRRTL